MVEQSGQSVDALRARLDALSQRHTLVAEADRRLADTVTSAHAVTVGALAQLDRIEAEIESAVSTARTCAVDTSAGARELQRLLIAKQREILVVVSEADEQSAMKTAVVQELLDTYRPPRE
jgi:Domain of unknown function (DUF4226)